MPIRCRSCGHDLFKLAAVNCAVETKSHLINAMVQLSCQRCGGHEFGVLDPLEEKMLRGSIVPA